MKKKLMLLALLLASIASHAQFEWVFEHTAGQEYLKRFLKTKKNQYVILHGHRYYPEEDQLLSDRVTVLDNTGAILSQYTIPESALGQLQINWFHDIIEMPDSTICLTALTAVGDPFPPWNVKLGPATFKLDSDGLPELLFIAPTDYIGNGVSLSDGSFVVTGFDGNEIMRYDGKGNGIWHKYIYDIFDLKVSQNDTILLATAQGLLVMDKHGNMAAQNPSLVFQRIKTDSQHRVIGMNNDSLYLLSPGYAVQTAAGYQGGVVRDFSVEDGRIDVVTAGGHVYRHDGELALLNDFQLSQERKFKYIATGAERLVLAGDERFGGADLHNGTWAAFVKEYSFEGGDYGLSNDIGVAGFEQGLPMEVFKEGKFFYVLLKELKVRVRNYGNKVVNNFQLRTQFNNPFVFENQNLAPGEEVELTLGDVLRKYATNPAGLNFELCVWTSHPDMKMDVDAGNDMICSDLLVGSGETMQQSSLKIYPNPAFNFLNIQWQWQAPANDAFLRVANMEGKVIQHRRIDPHQETVSLSVAGWPPGVYVLQLLSGDVIRTERFVVMR